MICDIMLKLKVTERTRIYVVCEIPISDWVDGASATETVDWSSIPGRVKQKTIQNGIPSFPAWRSAIKEQWSHHRARGRQVAAWLEDRKVPLLSPDQVKLVNRDTITNVTWILQSGLSPLHIAAFMGNLSIVEFLLENRVRVERHNVVSSNLFLFFAT